MNPKTIYLPALIWALAAVADAREPIALGILQPRLSPDEGQIAASYQGAIATLPAQGGTLRLLTHGKGWDIEPAWSPDGKRIAYIQTTNFSAGTLRILEADTGKEVELPKLIRAEGKLWWHPTKNRLLGSLKDRFPAGLSWYDMDSGEVTVVKIGPEDPTAFRRKRIKWALSPNGDEIIYAEHFDLPDEQGGNNGPMANVWRCDADGTNAAKLFEWPARIYDLAYDSEDKGIYAVTDQGTSHNDVWYIPFEHPLRDARKYTFSQADEERPSVGTVGNRLIFTTNSYGPTALMSHHFESGTQVTIPIEAIDQGQPTGQVSISVVDEATGQPVMARLSVREEGGKHQFPPGSLYRVTGSLGHFYGSNSEFRVPAGSYQVTALRGPEYVPIETTIEVGENQTASSTLRLKRWISMAERGWYSGENHVHANYGYGEWYNTPETILRQCQGEDLNLCNAVIANSDSDAVFDREFFLGRPDPNSTPQTILYWNQEFRATLWGHLTLSNLSELVEPVFTGFAHTTNPYDVPTNADIGLETLEQGGVVSYTHPAGNALDLYDQPYSAKGSPVDAALKRMQVMDVMGHTYAGSLQLWYKFLNCGFKITASAGTDCFLNRVRSYPPGWGRCYVHLPDGFDYASWTKGQVEGRSMITNGPMVFLKANDKGPGESISLPSSGQVTLNIEARSPTPLKSVEVIFNGDVIHSVAEPGTETSEVNVNIPHSGWLALRAEGTLSKYSLGRGLWAHTNPIYIQVGDKSWHSPQEAKYFLDWIDRLEAQFKKRNRVPSERRRKGVYEQFQAAREVYKKLLTAP